MCTTLKRILTLVLAVLMILGCFAACGNNQAQEETTEPKVTEPPEEAKVLKVLTLGHSLSVNSTHMLNLVADAEGYGEMVIGTLYYSGCPLPKHVECLTKDSKEYSLYMSSTKEPLALQTPINEVSMKMALEYDYWDVVIMQGGTFEIAESKTYTNGNIQTIQAYVKQYVKNPNAIFGWHLPWPFATDPELQAQGNYGTGYKQYDNDRRKLFAACAKCVEDHILTDDTFEFLIPSGAAVENAISSYMTEKDLLCDYAHATDFGRLIAAYTWFCVLTGIEQLEEIKLDAIPRRFVATSVVSGDRVLTEADKTLILESVNNALKNPLQITESEYKEAPEGYVPVFNVDAS